MCSCLVSTKHVRCPSTLHPELIVQPTHRHLPNHTTPFTGRPPPTCTPCNAIYTPHNPVHVCNPVHVYHRNSRPMIMYNSNSTSCAAARVYPYPIPGAHVHRRVDPHLRAHPRPHVHPRPRVHPRAPVHHTLVYIHLYTHVYSHELVYIHLHIDAHVYTATHV